MIYKITYRYWPCYTGELLKAQKFQTKFPIKNFGNFSPCLPPCICGNLLTTLFVSSKKIVKILQIFVNSKIEITCDFEHFTVCTPGIFLGALHQYTVILMSKKSKIFQKFFLFSKNTCDFDQKNFVQKNFPGEYFMQKI